MKNTLGASALSLLTLAVANCTGLSLRAQSITVTYDLENVWLLPDISHPTAGPQQMTGTFEWNYVAGDFENGSGQFLNYQIPWWSRTTPALSAEIDPGSIEVTMVGSYHDLGVDVLLRMVPPLSPDVPAPIDIATSSFQIETGTSRQGHVISGSVVPRCPTAESYGIGTAGSGGFVPVIASAGGAPRIGNASFQIDGDQVLGGAQCALFLSSGRGDLQALGVTFLVDLGTLVTLSAQASGLPGAAGAGALQFSVPIPNDPLLVGGEYAFQIVTLDPGSPQGLIAASDALAIVICR